MVVNPYITPIFDFCPFAGHLFESQRTLSTLIGCALPTSAKTVEDGDLKFTALLSETVIRSEVELQLRVLTSTHPARHRHEPRRLK